MDACRLLLLFSCFLHIASCQLNSGSVLSSLSLRTSIVSSSSNVFVSDDSSVYLLKGNLSEVVQTVRNEGQSPEGMALNSDQSKLIVCWANAVDSSGSVVNTAPCTVYDATTFASLVNVTLPVSFGVGSPRDETGQPPRDNRYGIGIGSDGSGGETFYAMSSLFEGNVKRLYHREYSIADGSVRRDEIANGATILDRSYYNGLKVGSYTYIIAKDTQNTGRIRVIRLCEGNSGIWDDWFEIQLICGVIDRNSADFRNTFIDASFLTAADGASEAMMVVTALSVDGSSDTCSFTLSSIDSAATRVFQYCVNLDSINRRSVPVAWMSGSTDTCPTGTSITECDLHIPPPIPSLPGGPRRLSTQVDENNAPTDLEPLNQQTRLNSFSSISFSSTEVFLVDGVVVMFAGLPNGEVRKYTAASFTANEVNPTAERTWSLSSSSAVKSLAHSTGSDYVYAVTDNMVHGLPVEECSNFTDCSSCTTSGGRLCGWCTVENKCSRTSQCSNSSGALRWVQTTGQCLTVSIASAMAISGEAKSYPREQGTIDVTIQNLPALLSGESFQCWFGQFGGGALVALGGTGYRCSVPAIPAFNGQDRQSVNFTLRSSLRSIDYGLVEDGVVFYDCAVRASCSSCVSSLNCNWCPVESTCATNSGGCSASAVSSSSSCPQLLPSSASGGRYYLHEGLTSPAVTLELTAMNLIGPTAGYSYSCELTNVSSTFTAAYNNATSVSCNINTAVTFSEPQRDSVVRLIWTNGSSNFAIESSAAMSQIATIFSCPRLGPDCSTCAGLNMNFDCVFCPGATSESCQLSTLNCQSGMEIAFGEFLQCPKPMVTDATPTDGPLQGGTMYTISGNNLGNHPIENVTILFGGRLCNISSSTSGALVCVVPAGVSEGEVSVTLSRTGVSGHPVGTFTYKTPTVSKVSPVKTPLKGGSIVSVEGLNLDIGNSQSTRVEAVFSSSRRKRQAGTRVQLTVTNVTPTMINCTSPDVSVSGSMTMDRNSTISVIIDGNDFNDPDVLLEFAQPTFTGLFDIDGSTEATLLQGGNVPLVFIGTNLDAAVSPELTIQPTGRATFTVTCTVISSTMLSCLVPALSNVTDDTAFSYSLTLDSEVLANLAATQPLTAVLDPVFTGTDPATYTEDSGQPLTISGMNLDNVRPEDYNITVGGLPCSDLTIASTRIFCSPPQSAPGGQTPAPVLVTVGARAGVVVGNLEYSLNLIVIILPAVLGALLICGFLLAIMLCCICYAYRSKDKERDRQFQGLITQMELMESELADECRRAFTELQTDLGYVYDKTDTHLPYLEFRSFAMRVLFPQESDHPVLQPLVVPKGLEQEDVMRQLDSFRQLIMDKKFLLIFIRTLEMQQGKFTVKDKCNVASLLLVAFQNDLDYANEILMALMHELIQRSVAKYHPKLLLRRTDSVAEKMLTNWLCFLLYTHVVEHIGEPLYVLFRAVKSQLEKGAIDVLTGEARQSLSEEKLLRTSTDAKPIEGVVVTESGDVPIKMWDCDSISQAKEKVLDAIYKNTPITNRPAINEVDLEFLQTSDKGLVLRDHDATNRLDGTWKKLNTLGHYNLTDVSAAYKSNPSKMSQPRFCLKPRSEGATVSGKAVDTIGTIVANQGASNGGAKPDYLTRDSQQVYHLVRPDESGGGDREGRGKIISEVFLTRLLSTKRILQPYVDDLFNAIFTIPKGKPLPKAIKYLFDFLDLEAADLSQHDPDVLHTWKTNSLPLRFWVNIIKNPEFVFDIHKSATVDSCLTVVAQAYIDGCSTTDVQYTKDTPSARLLYVNEVKSYKKKVREYFDQIQSLPKVSEYEMSSYLRELSQTNQQLYFVSESALFELFKYASTHSAALVEALNEEGLVAMANNFEQVRDSLCP